MWDPATDHDDDQLKRRLERCDGLVVGEGDGGAVEPPSAATTVVPLRRYPRPSQGSCSGERTTGILLVMISAKDDARSQELRDWADFIHLRHIAEAAVPGYRIITPWEHEEQGTPRFCHFYEMVGDDPQAVFERMTPLLEKRLTPEGFKDWAWHRQLVVEESRTYRRRPDTPEHSRPCM
jgi:hypothetical protein